MVRRRCACRTLHLHDGSLLVGAEVVADQTAAFFRSDVGTVLIDVDKTLADDWQRPRVSREEWSAA
jgi:hypothetical protein